ncbi:ABC transporter permease, partial [Bacteroidota bacterium]
KLSNTKRSFFSLRDSLVGIQFVISQILIIAVIIIASQMEMIKNKDLGFTKDSIINIELPEPDRSKMDVLRNKLLTNSEIKEVAFALGPPTSQAIMQTYCAFDAEGELKREMVQAMPVDENYISLFEIDLLAGSNFNRYVEGDTLYKYIINETMLSKMGIIDPNDALGKSLSVSRFRGQVIGVANDFHQRSLRETISPNIMTNFIISFMSNISVKISPNNVPTTLEYVENQFAEVFPGFIYNMEFYDEFLGQLYEAEERIFTIIQVFTILAIIIGCLGLFGLMSFIAVQRTKEIGIRKVMGASVPNILLQLSKQFSKVVIISNLIAWPIAFYAMDTWLENFAYKTDIGIMIFIFAGFVGLIISILSISFQAIKAAVANPINSLRYE